MRTSLVALLACSALAAACTGTTGDACPAETTCNGGGGGCKPSRTCATQGFQCGAFVDNCGTTQQCGSCATGTSCSKVDGTPGYCQFAGTLPPAGNPDGSYSLALPAEARPADTSQPTAVVGTGTAESCTYAALKAAVEAGGVITFRCGADPVIIPVTATLTLDAQQNTVIDGGNKITLDGGSAARIFYWNNNDNWQVNDKVLTLQHLVIANGKASGTEEFTVYPGTECPTGYEDGQGGALFMRDGILHAVDVTFVNNQAALLGPDTGGGAVYILGSKPATISRCSFVGNRASNGGGMGALFGTYTVYDSLFDGNDATGTGANDVDPTGKKCPYDGPNYQIGSGGNGGAMYSDGDGADVTICGTQVRNNHAGAFGAALFFTSNNGTGWLIISDSSFHDDVQDDDWWEWPWGGSGISTNANTKDPVNSTIESH